MSVWETLELEKIIKAALIEALGETQGDARFAYYTIARKHLLEGILDEIKAFQPEMTDHGPKHVRNVIENIQELLGLRLDNWVHLLKEPSTGHLSAMELYILGLSALFHDVGNVFDRKKHQHQIAPIYDYAMGGNGGNQDAEQKQLILDICKAHCGEGPDGSKNTLKYVAERSKIARREIRPNILAPILRLADELAEGEQRTSQFMIQQHNYASGSIQFHNYALSSDVDIDRVHGRIRLKYHITIRLPGDSESGYRETHGPAVSIEELEAFLSFVYHRIEKVNQERQYAKHYCNLLDPFKETWASFVFWYQQRQIPIDLSDVVLSDLVIPGDPQLSVVERNSAYEATSLIKQLSYAIANMT